MLAILCNVGEYFCFFTAPYFQMFSCSTFNFSVLHRRKSVSKFSIPYNSGFIGTCVPLRTVPASSKFEYISISSYYANLLTLSLILSSLTHTTSLNDYLIEISPLSLRTTDVSSTVVIKWTIYLNEPPGKSSFSSCWPSTSCEKLLNDARNTLTWRC